MRMHSNLIGLSPNYAKRWQSDRGQNLVEAALIVPIFLLLTFALIDFGTIFYVYLALENGVSQATRYAVTGQQMDDPANPTGPKLPRDVSIKLAMRQATPTLNIPDTAFAFSFYKPGSGTSSAGVGGPGDVLKVIVTYDVNYFTPLLRPLFANGKLTLSVSSTMRNENFS